MSIFNSKKSESPSISPAPSVASENSGLDDIKSEISNPPSVPQPPMPSPNMSNEGAMAPPQPPSAMMSPPSSQDMSSQMPPPMPNTQASPSPAQLAPQIQMPKAELRIDEHIEEESLFNLDDFELPSLDGVSYEKSEEVEVEELKLADPHPHKETHQLLADDFVPTKGLSVSKDDTYFLTTTEFKHLLEQIDSVKERIKTSTQRHMKILGIKAEEDIEIESLKKDFQFIEDRLYEVDSTIFDR